MTTSMNLAPPDLIDWKTIRCVYGLPCSWIQRLGDPDVITAHPHDPLRYCLFYSRRRVEGFIDRQRVDYLKMLVAGARESRPNDQHRCQQVEAIINWARGVEINVSPLPACPSELKQEIERYHLETNSGNFKMCEAALIAHVRHSRTNYPELLGQLKNRMAGATPAYLIIRHRINKLILRSMSQQYRQEILGGGHG